MTTWRSATRKTPRALNCCENGQEKPRDMKFWPSSFHFRAENDEGPVLEKKTESLRASRTQLGGDLRKHFPHSSWSHLEFCPETPGSLLPIHRPVKEKILIWREW